jgi:hypothetical protein
MASKKTKDDQVSGESKSSAKEKATRSVADVATDLIGDVERTAEALAKEVKQLFDNLSEKVAATASAAAETTASVADKVVAKDPAQLIRGLLGEVKAAGETSLTVISERFNALRRQLHSPANTEGKPANGASKKAIQPNKGTEGAQEAPAKLEKAVMQSGDETTSPAIRPADTEKVARKKAVVAKKAAQKKQVAAKAKSEAGTSKVGKKVAARASVAKKTPGKNKTPVTKAPIKKKAVPGGEQSGGGV